MNIKVCGITLLKQLQQLDGLDIDFAGLIFQKDSPRYVGDKLSGKELKNADFDLKTVGVFVDEEYDAIMRIVEEYGLDMVQLHGKEEPELCEQLSAKVEVIKTYHVGATTEGMEEFIAFYDEVCDYYLFDTLVAGGLKGGTGKRFDWSLLKKQDIEKPFFLSGGIGLAEAAEIKKYKHPDFYAVDINSQFEKEPGVKDMALVLQFRQALK